MQLGATPVIPGSLIVSIDETPLTEDDDRPPEESRWKEVDELLSHGPNDRVFTLDPVTGVVTFGDGRHGAAVPPGFRNVRAEKYEVGGGRAGAVADDEITTLLNSAPFLTEASNPLPASGGTDAEDRSVAVQRGPATIRARDRAVTVTDYALLARFAPGADVRRAHAIANFHPLYPGGSTPGVVGVLVVPPVQDAGPPIPDEQTLRAVSEHLSDKKAPAGVEVVAAAPVYRRIRVEAGFVADPAANTGEIIRTFIEEFNRYVDPLQGGEDGNGWPFGGTLFFSELLRHLLQTVPNVRAISPLRLLVDGAPKGPCSDVPLGRTELFWPDRHQVIPVEGEEAE
jgi:predicted phage baseplate assembly protein